MLNAGKQQAWLMCDHRALRKYGLGAVRPFPAPYRAHLRSGYITSGATPEALAEKIGVPPEALADTISRFNHDAENGKDHDFGKGSTAYQTYLGDAENAPNPCLHPLDTGPYYAIRIYPGDIGTSIGLSTNGNGQVLDEDGATVEGLYACGNDMNSIMAGAYPGAGITLGPALTFGYVVGRHAAGAQATAAN
jgi:succinate dehydrogenase/fumarate reductase flavoprotein subunit